jgi:hypothetical protein
MWTSLTDDRALENIPLPTVKTKKKDIVKGAQPRKGRAGPSVFHWRRGWSGRADVCSSARSYFFNNQVDFSFEKLDGVRFLVVTYLEGSHRLGKLACACPKKRGVE